MHDVLVIVTDRIEIGQLLLAGESIAANEGRPLRLVAVKPRLALRENPGAQVERLFSLAKDAHAELTVYYHDDPAEIAIRCVRRYEACKMVIEIPDDLPKSVYIGRVRNACPEMPIHFVDERGVLSGYPTMYQLARSAIAL